ncbi:adenosylcobinamide-phosphate synthase CbiB [Vibrio maritimus]|uniref:adenosylcobinamide-phosphate synthase CbiB n=1 Tax=Vibrio maritimus TaxID=990268 RepID=UPI0037356652
MLFELFCLDVRAGITEHWCSYLPLSAAIVIAALSLDQWLGETKRFHPLVGFGWLANRVERLLRNRTSNAEQQHSLVKVNGGIAWALVVVPITCIFAAVEYYMTSLSTTLWFVTNALILYVTLGGRSLVEHADRVYTPLSQGDLPAAKHALSMVVSRDTAQMNEEQITSSTVETVLENGNDAVIGPIFWFVLFGAPGAVLFRLANTLDAMWGYKNIKYQHFGYASAKIDDLLGWAPARITAVLYAVQGQFKNAIHCWLTQARHCSSPNGGVVMTAGAGALGVKIGGPTYYDGILYEKRPMGVGENAQFDSIAKANLLVLRGSFGLAICWLVVSGAVYIAMDWRFV